MVLVLAFEIPFVTFFEPYINFDHSKKPYIVVIAVAVTMFLVDILISFNTAYYVQGKLEYDRKKIAWNYIYTGLLLDIVPICALSVQFFWAETIFYYISPFFYLKLYEVFKFQE